MKKENCENFLRKQGYLRPEALLEEISRLQSGNSNFISNEALIAAIQKRELLSAAFKKYGIRQLRYLKCGYEGIIFELNDNQLLKLWVQSDVFDPQDSFELRKDSRILQPIFWEALGKVKTKGDGDNYFGITAKPKISIKKIEAAAKRAYAKAKAAGAESDDYNDFLPKWMKKEMDSIRIDGLDEDLEPRNYGHMKDGRPVQFDCLGDAIGSPNGRIEQQKKLYPNVLTSRITGGITDEDLTMLNSNLDPAEAERYKASIEKGGLYLHGGFPTVDGFGPSYKGLDTLLGEATERKLKARSKGLKEKSLSGYIEQIQQERNLSETNTIIKK